MNIARSGGKRALFVGAAAMGLILVVAACQTSPFNSGPKTVSSKALLEAPAGKHAGTWQGDDLSIDFEYNRNDGVMDLSGTLHFADHMIYNFKLLRRFQVSVIFADQDARVLEIKGLTTEIGNFDPIPIRARLTLPPRTAFISFSYQGTAIEGDDPGGGGVSYFWEYPIH